MLLAGALLALDDAHRGNKLRRWRRWASRPRRHWTAEERSALEYRQLAPPPPRPPPAPGLEVRTWASGFCSIACMVESQSASEL